MPFPQQVEIPLDPNMARELIKGLLVAAGPSYAQSEFEKRRLRKQIARLAAEILRIYGYDAFVDSAVATGLFCR